MTMVSLKKILFLWFVFIAPMNALAISCKSLLTNRRTILLVENEEHLLFELKNFLKNETQHQILTSINVNEALNVLEKNDVDLILTDLEMPAMNAHKLIKFVKASLLTIPIVVMTDNANLKSAIETLNLGAEEFLAKPYNFDLILAVVRNIIKREELKASAERQQQRLIQFDKMTTVGILVEGISHEINNLLTVAGGNMYLLKQDIQDHLNFMMESSEKHLREDSLVEIKKLIRELPIVSQMKDFNKNISRLEDTIKRIENVVQKLRDFSHLDSGDLVIIDINKSLDNTIQMIPQKYKNNIEVKTNFAELPKLPSYGRQLNHAFFNIVLNALQSLKNNGELEITTQLKNEYIYISFRDSGPGISKDKLKWIFDPYYTTRPTGEGVGLGLSISFSVVRRHGGEITVVNNPDKGVTFIVELPVEGVKNNDVF